MMTHPGREATAEHHARRQGFEVWFPRTAPSEFLFPRYGFVNVLGPWRALLSTIGVADVLRNGDEPSFVPQAEYAALRVRERAGLVVLPPRQRFVPGERVRVEHGRFAGLVAVFENMTRHE